jgi:hypothetical protein
MAASSRVRNCFKSRFNNQRNEVRFRFRVTQAEDGRGHFAVCHPAAGVCITKAGVGSLSIPANTAEFSGRGLLDAGTRVTFSVSD